MPLSKLLHLFNPPQCVPNLSTYPTVHTTNGQIMDLNPE
jgi:hypothetical protein